MNERLIHPVLLSGGAGTRLWPLSRVAWPKQLLPLLSDRTLLQETAQRLAGGVFAPPLVVCNEQHRFLVSEQLREIDIRPSAIMLEPTGRNTAPAVTAAALLLARTDPDAVLLVQPADHRIGNVAAFRDAVAVGERAALTGRLVTFGVSPTHPETGYGYISPGMPLDAIAGAFSVDRFVEKPDAATAESFISDGFLWNSGIFMFTARRFLDELALLEPAMLDSCRTALNGGGADGEYVRLDAAAFGRAADAPIDRAVMERTRKAAVVPVDMDWSDIGSWRRLRDAQVADTDGNVAVGDVVAEGVRNSYIRAQDHLVAAVGLDNVVIVATGDSTLVAHADRSEEVSRIVARLRGDDRRERLEHGRVHRPWGSYQTVDAGARFQVKRISVKPGASLSLQMHHHRAEHWVVVSGVARVTCNDDVRELRENESAFIPLGARHRLENPGPEPLELIEVQCGGYLGEDDIVRFEDRYGRDRR